MMRYKFEADNTATRGHNVEEQWIQRFEKAISSLQDAREAKGDRSIQRRVLEVLESMCENYEQQKHNGIVDGKSFEANRCDGFVLRSKMAILAEEADDMYDTALKWVFKYNAQF